MCGGGTPTAPGKGLRPSAHPPDEQEQIPEGRHLPCVTCSMHRETEGCTRRNHVDGCWAGFL
jgi:hypothetical protein